MPAQREVAPRRVAQLQRKYLRQQGATPQEIRRYQPVLTAQIGAESNFTQGVGSPAGARDIAQFMPGTAPGYGVKLGDNRIKDDIRGQVRYMLPLLRKYGVEGALRGYNAGVGAIERSKGFSETNQYVERVRGSADEYRGLVGGGGGSNPAGGTPGQRARYETIPGVDNSQARQQAKLSYLDDRYEDPRALLTLKSSLDASQDVPSERVRVPGSGTSRNDSQPGRAPRGEVTVAPGADREGVRTNRKVIKFARRISGIAGMPVTIGTGTNHSQMTVSGNVSQHWTGDAADIPASGKQLIRLGRAALIAAGMSKKQARRQTGGLFNVNGRQIIFNTHEGGDHTDHLHFGL